MKRLVLTFALLIGLAAPAWAGIAEGVTAYSRGDYATALRELRPLAEQGDSLAQSYLGFMYAKGQGVPQDDAEAAKWFRKTAEQGDADAQYLLGFLYAEGPGVPQDFAEAAKWLRKAAMQGYAFAQGDLGFMYEKGRGVPQDYVQAHMWYNLAASRLPPGTKRDLAVKNRDIVAAKMTPAQISKAQRLAREWKPKKKGK